MEPKSAIEDHTGGWTMWEVISAVRHTLCLRQYYLDQVFGYNLSTVINLTILSQNKYVECP